MLVFGPVTTSKDFHTPISYHHQLIYEADQLLSVDLGYKIKDGRSPWWLVVKTTGLYFFLLLGFLLGKKRFGGNEVNGNIKSVTWHSGKHLLSCGSRVSCKWMMMDVVHGSWVSRTYDWSCFGGYRMDMVSMKLMAGTEKDLPHFHWGFIIWNSPLDIKMSIGHPSTSINIPQHL